jgi:hypothetical protein
MRPTGHIRQRSPGSWELRYSPGTDAATGKRRILTATVRGDRKAAERELRRLLRTLDDGSHVDPTRITLRAWFVQWLAAALRPQLEQTPEGKAALERLEEAEEKKFQKYELPNIMKGDKS